MIGPYMPYQVLGDLDHIDACARTRLKRPDYYRCFVSDGESGGMVPPKPKRGGRKR
jgi:hypothetical protein